MFQILESAVALAVKKRWWVIFIASGLMGLGILSFTQLKIDAYPDISGVQVQLITPYAGRAAEEVEQQVTIPLERAMAGVPHVESVRSRTIFGLSNLQLVFDSKVNDDWARGQVFQKMAEAEIPDDAKPELASLSNNYGEIYRYELIGTQQNSSFELRTLHDWVVIPALLRVKGVVEVGNFGGLAKQYTVRVDRDKLLQYRLCLQDVIQAIKANNTLGGGNIIDRGSTSLVVRGLGRYSHYQEMANILVRHSNGTLVYLKDIAQLEEDHLPKTGEFGIDHRSDSIEGIVRMRRGEDAADVLPQLQQAVDELNHHKLPVGVQIKPFFSRETLIKTTLHSVSHNVILGIVLVLLSLFAFLRNGAISFIVALTIPFSFLFALILMKLENIPISLLSVGAIDFGIIVDGGVIVAENIARLMAIKNSEKNLEKTVILASQQVLRPMLFSMLIVILAYLPLLSLQRIEGQLFRPMAMTLCFAFAGALLGALFLVPALFRVMIHPSKALHDNPFMDRLSLGYEKLLSHVVTRRKTVMGVAFSLLVVVIVGILPRLGTEFLPYLDEGSFWIRATFPEGISLKENAKYSNQLRELIKSYPEVKFVLSQSGRVDTGTDPYPLNRCEMMVGLNLPQEWKNFHTKFELEQALQERLKAEFPTIRLNLSQPIMDGVTEDTNGTSADLAVELSGPDLDVLRKLGDQASSILSSISGNRNVYREQEGPQPQLQIHVNRQRIAAYQVPGDAIMSVINTAIGGQPITSIFENERRFNINVKYLQQQMGNPSNLGLLPIFNEQGQPIPLAQLADIRIVDGETLIARANGLRRITVRTDIRDRSQGEFVAEAQDRFQKSIHLPEGYSIGWKGMFENLDRARKHFAFLIPLTILIIFSVLMFSFNSIKTSSIVLLNLPFALIGSAVALFLRGMHLSVSAGVGFTSLFGVSVMQGVLMVNTINDLRNKDGFSLKDSVCTGAKQRLRPILMTSLTAMIGLFPASLATGVGTDVQRPIATVVVWGIFSATLVTLFVLPVIYISVFSPQRQAALKN